MRGAVCLIGFIIGLVAVGCAKDKYHLNPTHKEEIFLPPNEKRYNEPETAPYQKKREQTSDQKTLLDKPMPGPTGLGGF
ncbi:MAG TPA: hypothetical protein VLM40_11805 [Gemmata sp.]|nr:hypothetical protein [Gemmata sp.]